MDESHRAYYEAFRRGLIPDSIIDAAVTRVLRAKFELGLFEHPYVDPDSAAYWNGSVEHRALAREAARTSLVLLKNDRNTLPLSRALRSVVVIGVDAAESRLGGYSGPGINRVSMLDGIRERLKGATVRYVPGPGRITREHVVIDSQQLSSVDSGRVVRGLRGEYFDNNTLAGAPGYALPENTSPGLEVAENFQTSSLTYGLGVHAVELEVDIGTGGVTLLNYVAVNDGGRIVRAADERDRA